MAFLILQISFLFWLPCLCEWNHHFPDGSDWNRQRSSILSSFEPLLWSYQVLFFLLFLHSLTRYSFCPLMERTRLKTKSYPRGTHSQIMRIRCEQLPHSREEVHPGCPGSSWELWPGMVCRASFLGWSGVWSSLEVSQVKERQPREVEKASGIEGRVSGTASIWVLLTHE